jgi:23S rRNA pseudouridine1911/1915/1917 synthase
MDTQQYISKESERLDIFLSECLGQTRSQVIQLIKKGCVTVGETVTTKPGTKLKPKASVSVLLPPAKTTPAQQIDFDVPILFEDEDLLVINKPSGLVTHPAPSVNEPTLVDWLKAKNIRLSTLSGEERHGIVHRLDKGTSGAMVIAKNNEAHETLSKQLQNKSMGRYYLAVVTPPLKEYITTVEAAICRNPANRLKMCCTTDGGRYAKTEFKRIALSYNGHYDLLVCKLFTGRTHQIRVHLEKLGRHILGEHLYGAKKLKNEPKRILLHAYMLYFLHPKTKIKQSFVAPMDDTLSDFIQKNFSMEEIDEKIQRDTLELGFSSTL